MATSGAPTRKHGPTTSPGSTTYASARRHRETMLQRSPWVGISLRSSGLVAFFVRYARSALISPIFDLNPLERARTELKLAPGFLVRSAPKPRRVVDRVGA